MTSRRRRKPPGATTRGGWGSSHQKRRAAIAPLVNAGKATCARCNAPIHPREEWHLDHNEARNGYLGASHATCNLRAAAAVTNGRRPLPHFEVRPYRRSQRWFADPLVGTIAGRDIYVGNGEWQPLGDTPLE